MPRSLSKIFLMIPIVIFFFIFVSCAQQAVREEETTVTPAKPEPKAEEVIAKPVEKEEPAETKVPTPPVVEEKPEAKEEVGEAKKEMEPAVVEVKELSEAERRRQSEERAFTTIDIYFDFDKYNLKPKAREVLADKAYWLKKNPTVKIYIEGHCDERGTNEYNLALGERRANSAKTYLISLGISEDRIGTISYGEERPVDPGHNEEAWAKNRRDRFVIVSR